jgi:hypothetical protein
VDKGRLKERSGLELHRDFLPFKNWPKTERGLDSRIYCMYMIMHIFISLPVSAREFPILKQRMKDIYTLVNMQFDVACLALQLSDHTSLRKMTA